MSEDKVYTQQPPPYSAVAGPGGLPPQQGQSYGAPLPPGYQPYYAPPMQPPPTTYGATTVTVTPIATTDTVIIVGSLCPICRLGTLQEEFSCVGILCAILFFPLGLLCCLLMRSRRCTNCRAVFD